MKKLLFAADLHMGHMWKGFLEKLEDSHDSWRQIVDLAVDEKVDGVVLGGDVFDRQPMPETVRAFLEGVWKLRDKGIPIYAIQGQHARGRNLAWSSIDPYVVDLAAQSVLGIGKFNITGLDNMSPNELKEMLGAIHPSVNVLVLHQMMRGMVPNFGGHELWDCDTDWIPDHVKLVLLGDYHSPVEQTVRNTFYKYNGSTVLCAIDEPKKKFCHIVTDDFKIRALELKVRPAERFLILTESEEKVSELLEAVKNMPAGAIVYVKHHPNIAALEDRCREVNRKVHLIMRPATLHEEIVGTEEHKIESITLRNCLDELLKKEQNPFLYDFLVALLTAQGSPSDVIAQYREKCTC